MSSADLTLVVGMTHDPPVAGVLRALRELGVPFIHWSPRSLANDCSFTMRGGTPSGWVLAGDHLVELKAIRGVYYRPASPAITPEFRELPPDHPLTHHATASAYRLDLWCELTSAFVMNRTSTNASNSSKAYQARLIAPHFDVPASLVTNNPEAAIRFAKSHDRIVFKSCSGERSIVTECLPADIERRSEALRACPVLFQQYIPGNDVRIHVVGEKTFATAVRSTATDYRYDAEAEWCEADLPRDICESAVALTQTLDLEISGIDLRVTPEGRVYCLEVNPSPAFSAYEDATGQPIAQAIARRLAGHG